MKKFLPLLTILLLASPALALDVAVSGIENGKPIPEKFAFCMKDGKGETQNASNINPGIAWSNPPAGTKSYALIVVDKDVPTVFDNANQHGKTIAENAPRRDFYHWVLTDIPAGMNSIAEGQDSNSHKENGKPTGKTAYGVNGQNDFASFMKGTFGGYDGPCPPWNDERLHHYHFRIYALDIESLGLSGDFTGKEAEAAIAKHTLVMGEVVGTYSNAK